MAITFGLLSPLLSLVAVSIGYLTLKVMNRQTRTYAKLTVRFENQTESRRGASD